MKIESKVDFEEVMATFSRENAKTPERNDWPMGALKIADRQFRSWARVMLDLQDLGQVMLPQHHHYEVDLVPATGASVSDTVKRLDVVDTSSECYKQIEQFSNPGDSAIFLSIAPIKDPRYWDYGQLVARGYQGLTHLDGLHRLIAWTIEGRSNVLAYVAGL